MSSYERYYKVNIQGKEIAYKTSYLIEEDIVINKDELKNNSLDDIALLIVERAKLTLS